MEFEYSFEVLEVSAGVEVPSKTMLVLSEVKLVFVAVVSLKTMLALSKVKSVFMIIASFVSFAVSRFSPPDCCNQRQVE